MPNPLKTILQKVKQPDFFPNHYEILGISDFGTYNPKKKLYRLQENKNEILELRDQTKLTRLINQADKVLKDQALKSKYDQQLRDYLAASQKSDPKQGQRPARKQATAPKEYKVAGNDHLKTTSTLLGVMNVFGTLGVVYLNWGLFSWYYSLYIAFMGVMIMSLLKALSLKSISEVITEDNGSVFLLAGIFYFFYNQELLILAVLSIITLLLIKAPIIRRSNLLLRTAPIICSLLVFFSIWVIPSLNEKYFPEVISGYLFPLTPVPQDTIFKTYVETYYKRNIRDTPNGNKLNVTTIPGQLYEVLGSANEKNWYRILYNQDTSVLYVTHEVGRFIQDTVVISQH